MRSATSSTSLFTVSVNLHGTSVERRSVSSDRLVGRFGYGKYLGDGTERLLKLLEAHQISATFFVPIREAELHPFLIEELIQRGHEIAANGYELEDHSKLGEKEKDVIKRTHEALSSRLGKSVAGWRAPYGMVSEHTRDYLAEIGFSYDSSFQDDDHPYIVATGKKHLVEIPQNQMLMDQTLFGMRQTDGRVFTNWVEEFDGLQSEGCYGCMTLHPRSDYGIGRASRIMMLDRFFKHLKRIPGAVMFRTCAEVAQDLAFK
ncbi:chitin deacetylase [Bradyrhizobium ottawaense]|uniref:polysaccharide deacetylase family protein n=1 Tax=Bradyrhizobium ottawaense TaxID=931866 RepID=UPI000BE7E858|nr:polysaccharide deacetylase family protein [Bradyrhizobium ottawaense]PDT63989.1 chitin deacetylase [Bradyrhizobium ottawaense]